MHLPHIARLAKRLGIAPFVFSSAHDWNNVVENQFKVRLAPFAARRFPFSALHRRKVSSVSLEFPSLIVSEMSAASQKSVPIFTPSFTKRGTHFFPRFWRLLIAAQLSAAFFASSSSAFTLLDSSQSVSVVSLSPKGIVGSGVSFASAFRIFTSHSQMAAFEVMPRNVKHCSANETGNIFTSSYIWHGNSYLGVNSVETPLYAFSVKRAIPSQAPQECGEGVTTRAWSPDRTVKPHERTARKGRYSLGLLGIAGSADKEPRDNTNDETINVGENSPISAAQFSIAQYAGAVTMSGLQMLQNS